MFKTTDDIRVTRTGPLLPPLILAEEIPVTEPVAERIREARADIADILHGREAGLIAVVGPCSIHDPVAGLDYAKHLADYAAKTPELAIVMRVYFEKPRTTVGWKGLINDPGLDDSYQINRGLRLARKFLLDVNELGLPAGCEFLDPITPQFITDLVSWGAIGARTTESQVHRELASGLSMPVGFKNGTAGTVKIAVDAVRAAASPHAFVGVTKQGLAAIVHTTGNPNSHVILRGGSAGPNYDAESVKKAVKQLETAGLPPRLMVDCSHANSAKDHNRQPIVASEIAQQLGGGHICGVMLESNLRDGRQNIGDGALEYGKSVTDACIGWEQTVPVLDELAAAVRKLRG